MNKQLIQRFYQRHFVALLFIGLFVFAEAVDFSAVPGTVIDYQKLQYVWNANAPTIFIADPSIAVLPNGDYIASDSLSGSGTTAGTSGRTELFRSTNRGVTWTSLGTKNGMLRGSLFVFGGNLYLLGANDDTDGMPAVIMRSTDNGTSWSAATQMNLAGPATPNNPVVSGNRLWCATGNSALSVSINSNLLTAASWISSGGFPAYEPGWPSEGEFIGEGQMVASPEKGIFILPKVKNHALTAVARVDPSSGAVSFDPTRDFIGLPGGEKKFGAAYDPVSSNFYVLSNPILPAHTNSIIAADMIRNTAAVLSSRDLFNWKVEKLFLYSSDIDYDGFGYMNFDFDGTNMVVVARTAFKVQDGVDPRRGHDSNLLTFHRLNDFRNLHPDQYLTISGNQILRFERTDYEPAPLGRFTLGSVFAGAALTSPNGTGKTAGGDVYVRESGGRILHFDAAGNFIKTNSTSPVSFQSSAMDISPLQGGECSWVRAGSGSWDDLLNWYYWGRPDTPEEVAVFGSAATAATTVSIPSKSREWLFNTAGNLEGWATANLTGTAVAGGVFSATPTSTDPQLSRTDQSFAGTEVPTVTVRMRAAVSSATLQFYWATSASNSFHGSRLVTAAYTGNGAFQDVVFSLQGHAQWDGQIIRRLRIDPLNGPMIPFEIDAITVKKEATPLRGLRFRNSYPYTLSGEGLLSIGPDSGTGVIEAQMGTHAIQVPVVLNNNTDFRSENSAGLQMAGGLNFNGKILTVSGSGLTLANSFSLNGGTLAITAGSTVAFVGSGGTLNGTLTCLAPEGFFPEAGETVHLIDGDMGAKQFDQVILPVLEDGLGWDSSTLYSNGTITVIVKVPSSWMASYGLPQDGSADFIDSDGDGQDNYSEWKAGTNPTNKNSFFTFDASGSQPVPAGFQLRWNSLSERTYRVERSTNLTDNPAFSVLQSGIPGAASSTDFIDATATNLVRAFYRVYVE